MYKLFSLQMVIVGRNSLNNRFLPFSNIETEAVLALDDDQLVPFNQLELAFRYVLCMTCTVHKLEQCMQMDEGFGIDMVSIILLC